MLNPFLWRAGHWAMFGVVLTLAADILAGLYVFNLFGINRKFEVNMWLLIAGVLGFASITVALFAIFFRSGRTTGILALPIAFVVGGAPAWLVLNTLLQLILGHGTLPDAPIDW